MSKAISSIFGGFVSDKPKSLLLPVGWVLVAIQAIFEINSFTNLDGSEKVKDRGYGDSCPQMGFTFVGAGSEAGVLTHRTNGLGYYRTSDFSPEDIKKYGIVDADGFATVKGDNDVYVRMPHEGRTADCMNIMNQLFRALDLPVGSKLEDIVPGLLLEVEVKEVEWDGKTRKEISGYRIPKEVAVEADVLGG